VAFVPTGIKIGVSIFQCGVEKTQVLDFQSLFITLYSNIFLKFILYLMSRLRRVIKGEKFFSKIIKKNFSPFAERVKLAPQH
jgi:hypothetical protein